MKKTLILSFLLSLLLISSYFFVRGRFLEHIETTYCGTVVEVQNQPHQSKSITYYDQYILMNFDSIGMKAIQVDMTTFMSRHPGDRCCFALNERQCNSPEYTKHGWMGLIGAASMVILIFIIIIIYLD